MGLIQLEKPKIEPVTLVEAKTYLRLDHNDEDELIDHLICTARQSIESYTAQSLIEQSWRFTFSAAFTMQPQTDLMNGFAANMPGRGIEIPKSPFIKLIQAPMLLDHDKPRVMNDYKLKTSGRIAYLNFGINTYSCKSTAMIQIDFLAGYSQLREEIPAPFRQAILMTVGYLYAYQSSANDNGLAWLPLNETVIQLIKPYRVLRLN